MVDLRVRKTLLPTFGHRQSSRAIVILFIAVTCVACGATSAGRSDDRSLMFALATNPICLDPQVSTQDVVNTVTRGILDSLVYEKPDHTIAPWLASSWEESPDLTSYVFHLRRDVIFSDGSPFDATVVKTNFDRIVSPATKSQYAATLLGPYVRTDVVDRYTARVVFASPFAPFLISAATPNLGMFSTPALTKSSETLCSGEGFVGSGPFTLGSFSRGYKIVLNRNSRARPTARDIPLSRLDSVVFRILPEDRTRLGAIASGQVDGADSIPTTQIKTIEHSSELTLRQIAPPGMAYSLYLNTSKSPFNDPRVRQAFAHALALDQTVSAVYGGQYPRAHAAFNISNIDSHRTDSGPTAGIAFDRGMAERLLDDAGWKRTPGAQVRTRGGTPLDIVWPALPASHIGDKRTVLAFAMISDLERIGFHVVHTNTDTGIYSRQLNSGDYDVADLSWSGTNPDALRQFFGSTNALPRGQNISRLDDPSVDNALATATTSADPDVRKRQYALVQKRVVETGAVVPVYIPQRVIALKRSVDVTFGADGSPRFLGFGGAR
ncbi:ABC transporter substrate-binding protein [Gordonia effusa]|nr:ABC transporter substrate-binding protein [Gordonia effusa]